LTIEEVLLIVIEKLEAEKIDYMLTGSFASNLHGVPRTTFDADIIISANLKKLKKFIEEVKNDFYVESEMLEEAFLHRSIFNIIHYKTGFKIDFIIKKQGAYYEKEFERRKIYKLSGKKCYFTSPEDVILTKLIWAKESQSEKQFQDALGVLKVQKENLDYEYLAEMAKVLNITDMLEKILKEIKV